MAGVATLMGWPLAEVTYKRLKTILGRPKVEDHSEVLTALRTNSPRPRDLRVRQGACSRRCARSPASRRPRYGELQAKVDQSCKFESHESKQLIGRDCPNCCRMKTSTSGKRRRAGATPSRVAEAAPGRRATERDGARATPTTGRRARLYIYARLGARARF